MTGVSEKGIRLHVDRKVLRDILTFRMANEKRHSFYTVGSVFTGMGFTLVAIGSTNYTASTFFVLIGILVYMCIGGVSVDYSCEGYCVGEDEEEWKEPVRFPQSDYEEEVEEDEADSQEENIEYKELSALSKDEKAVIFRMLFHELSGVEMSQNDIERILHPTMETDSAVETASPPSTDGGVTIIENSSTEGGEDEQEDEQGPRLARAETSYSGTVEEPIVVETIASPIQTPVDSVNESDEVVNNGTSTPESSSDAGESSAETS